MSSAPAHDGPPRRVGPLRRARWWIADYAYAAVWQVRARLSFRAPREFLSGPRTPVVILPGVYEHWRFMLPLITELHDRGHPIHVVPPLGMNRRPIDESARLVSAHLAAADVREAVIVAHSKGGLIGKRVLAEDSAGHRARAMVAIATPFGGSRYARFMVGRTLREFSPRDRALVALAGVTGVNARIVSVFPEFDPHVPEGSALTGARNVLIETGGHFRVLAHPRTLAEVFRALAEPTGPGRSAFSRA